MVRALFGFLIPAVRHSPEKKSGAIDSHQGYLAFFFAYLYSYLNENEVLSINFYTNIKRPYLGRNQIENLSKLTYSF